MNTVVARAHSWWTLKNSCRFGLRTGMWLSTSTALALAPAPSRRRAERSLKKLSFAFGGTAGVSGAFESFSLIACPPRLGVRGALITKAFGGARIYPLQHLG